MALSNSQYDAIMREYGKQQMENQHSQEARKKEVYEKVPAVKELEAEIAERSVACARKLLEGSQVVVIDTNLPAESIAWLADNCHAPIFADPVSTVKAEKLRPVLGKLHTLKPNRLEAELLSGVPITDTDSLHRAAQTLLETKSEAKRS